MLKNKFYIGILRYHGEYYQVSHKCFITKQLFDEVQRSVQELKDHGKKDTVLHLVVWPGVENAVLLLLLKRTRTTTRMEQRKRLFTTDVRRS